MDRIFMFNSEIVKQKYNDFINEKSNFNNTTYPSFTSSYLKTNATEQVVVSMSNSLDGLYKRIQNAYNNISNWWNHYNDTVDYIENVLSNNSFPGSYCEDSVRNYVSNHLGEFPTSKMELPNFSLLAGDSLHIFNNPLQSLEGTHGSNDKQNISSKLNESSNSIADNIKVKEQYEEDLKLLQDKFNSFLLENESKIISENESKIKTIIVQIVDISSNARASDIFGTTYEEYLEKADLYKNEIVSYIFSHPEYFQDILSSNESFYDIVGMTYEEYLEKVDFYKNEIVYCKSLIYSLEQQEKLDPYIKMMDTEEFEKYKLAYDAKLQAVIDDELDMVYFGSEGNMIIYVDAYIKKDFGTLENSSKEAKDLAYACNYEYLTDDERILYSYIFETQGYDEASKFIIALEDKINKTKGKMEADRYISKIIDENAFSNFISSASDQQLNEDDLKKMISISFSKNDQEMLYEVNEYLFNKYIQAGLDSSIFVFDENNSVYSIIETYNNLKKLYGNEAADIYIENIEFCLSSCSYALNISVKDGIAKYGTTFVQGFLDGFESFFEGLDNVFNTKGMISANQYTQMYIASYLNGKIALNLDYQVSTSIGNMMPTVLIGTLSGGASLHINAFINFLSTYGNTKNQALVQGNDLVSSSLNAMVVAASEVGLEYIMGGISGLSAKATKSVYGNPLEEIASMSWKKYLKKSGISIVKNMFDEAGEELLQTYIEAGSNYLFFNEKFDIIETTPEALYSAVCGAIVSLVFSGATLSQVLSQKVYANNLYNNQGVELGTIVQYADSIRHSNLSPNQSFNIIEGLNDFINNNSNPIDFGSIRDSLNVLGTNLKNLIDNGISEVGTIASNFVNNNAGYVDLDALFNIKNNNDSNISSNLITNRESVLSKNKEKIQNMRYIDLLKRVNKNNNNNMSVGELKQQIIESIPEGISDFEKARYVYLELSKNVGFNENLNDNPRENSYFEYLSSNSKITDDTKLNGKVICKSWAIIYNDLLCDIGINSQMKSANHAWVEFEVNGQHFLADATNSAGYLNDLARVTQSEQTEYFYPIKEFTKEEDTSYCKYPHPYGEMNSFNSLLYQVDKDLNYIQQDYKNVIKELCAGGKNLENNGGTLSSNLKNKLLMLNSELNLSKLGYIEGKSYLLSFIKKLSDTEANLVSGTDLYKLKKNNDVDLINITSILQEDGSYKYLAYHENMGLIEITKSDLDQLRLYGYKLKSGKDIEGYKYSFMNVFISNLNIFNKFLKISSSNSDSGNTFTVVKDKNLNDIRNNKIEQLTELAQLKGMSLKELGSQKAITSVSSEQQLKADTLAKDIRTKAELTEPIITADMKNLESENAHLVGLDHKLKSIDSLTRKIITDSKKDGITLEEAASSIGDSVRYTLLLNEETYLSSVESSLDQLVSKGYTVKKFKNFWGDEIYQGINMSLISPDGLTLELQFHTEDSFNTKESLNHLYYEIARNDFTTLEEKTLANEIMAINQSNIKVPEGILKYKYSVEPRTVEIAKNKLFNVHPKLVHLYESARQSAHNLPFFLGFEEHNFVHVTRVAEESVSVLGPLYELIDSGKIKGYGKIDSNIVYKSGLAHDLGMSQHGFVTFKDNTTVAIDDIVANPTKYESQIVGLLGSKTVKKVEDIFDLEGQLVRKFHPLNSAILVLQNQDMFGSESEMIACLALIHSKSTSGVKNIDSYSQLSAMVETLYKNSETCGYEFDASKLVECDSEGKPLYQTIQEEILIQENGESITKVIDKQVYIFKESVLETFRTGAVALRVGDAHAHKTGNNHAGESININLLSDSTMALKLMGNMNASELCISEAENAIINVGDTELAGGNYDYSKQIVLGESNSYTGDVYIENGILTYEHYVRTSDNPACTWVHGISEKIGEYATFSSIQQKMKIYVPQDSSDALVAFYQKQASKFIENKNYASWLEIEIIRIENANYN